MAVRVRIRRTTAPSVQLGVSANGRYLATASGAGTPVFLRCFSAWPVILSDPSRWDDYLDSVQALGFNCLKLQVISKWGDDAPATFNGTTPFTGANFSTPREAYFAIVDSFLANCAARGLYLWLFPLYYGYEPAGSGQGWYPEAASAGVSVIQTYAGYIGNRYGNNPWIIWGLAGDHTPGHSGTTESAPKLLKAVLDGLRGAGAAQLAAPHFAGEDTSAIITPDGHTWDLYTYYTWSEADSEYVLDGYAANDGPVAEVEVKYEHNTTQSRVLRQPWIRAMLGGAVVVDYGNEGWGYPDADNAPFWPGGDWEDYVNDEGAVWYKVVADKLTAEAWHTLVPEAEGASTLVTTGGGTIGTTGYVSRCKDAAGTIAFFYVYDGHSFGAARGQMSGTFRMWWIDPTTGTETEDVGSPYTNSGTLTINAGATKGNNADGDPDWIIRWET